MQNRGLGIAVAAIGVVAAVVLFVVLSGGDDSDDSSATSTTAERATTTTADGASSGERAGDEQSGDGPSGGEQASVPTIVIKGGEPVGGVQELTFTEGGDIRFIVESDVADGVHFHGYDIEKEVEAGGEVEFNVAATITGLFEVELEERVVPIAEITVNP